MLNLNVTVAERYEILDLIGQGGMGVVYSATDRLTRKRVALKSVRSVLAANGSSSAEDATVTLVSDGAGRHLLPGDLPGGNRRSRLLPLAQEFQVLASLRHPNIIEVLDYGFDAEGSPFYTMEILDGAETLVNAAIGLPLLKQMDYVVQLLRALMYLHRHGVLHRDLKPSNVLVLDGQVKVLDFGLATQQTKMHGEFAGTLDYAAPELFLSQPPSRASDLYAVGIMAFQILSGVHPFKTASGSDLIRHHIHSAPDISQLKADPGVREVIGQLLRKQPGERWASAEEVIDALSQALESQFESETLATRESFLRAAPFTDRAEEQNILGQALSEASAGAGQIWFLEGENGIGKSRLVEMLRSWALVEDVTVVTGQGAANRLSYDILREPLRRLALSARLSGDEGSLLQLIVPDIEHALGRDLSPRSLEPQQAHKEIAKLVTAIFERQNKPVLLILEDLHWTPEILEFLNQIAEPLSALPVLIVGTYRGEEAPGFVTQLADANIIHLSPLLKRDIRSLTRSMLGERGDSDDLVDFLEKHTGGHLLFIVELVRALAEKAGDLDKVSGRELPERLVAEGIRSLVLRRLSFVPPEYMPFLDLAAVDGQELDSSVLAHILGRDAVEQAMLACAAAGILESRNRAWRFRQAQFRETLLDQMNPARQRELHHMVGSAVESVYGASTEQAAALAHHFHATGDREKEARYASLAGLTALRRGTYREACRFLERALVLTRLLSERNQKAELELLLQLGSVYTALKGWSAPEVKQLYDEAIELARAIGSEADVAPPIIGLAKYFFIKGELSNSREYARACLRLGESSGDAVMQQHGRLLIGECSVWLGEFAKDRGYVEDIARLYRDEQMPVHLSKYGQDARLTSFVSSSVGTWMLGFPDRALGMSREALLLAQRGNNSFSEAIAYQIKAWVRLLRGEAREALLAAEKLLFISNKYGFPPFAVLASAVQGWAAARMANPQGVATIRRAMETWAKLGAGLASSFYASLLADACLHSGLVNDGLAAISHLLSSGSSEERNYLPELWRLRAELLSAKGEFEEACLALQEALRLADEQEAKSYQLRIATSALNLGISSLDHRPLSDRLRSLYSWFQTKGETPDLHLARRFLVNRS